LRALIKTEDLVAGSQVLEDIAFSYPERNRVFGGDAHNDVVDWIAHELRSTGYYHVEKQEQKHLWSKSDQTLLVNGKAQEPQSMTYSPSGNVTAPMVLVENLGCDEVSFNLTFNSGSAVCIIYTGSWS
jgi:carboxypeptidase Q